MVLFRARFFLGSQDAGRGVLFPRGLLVDGIRMGERRSRGLFLFFQGS